MLAGPRARRREWEGMRALSETGIEGGSSKPPPVAVALREMEVTSSAPVSVWQTTGFGVPRVVVTPQG